MTDEKSINAKILFVDDETNILKALERELGDEPYEKYFVTSGKEALKIMRSNDIAVIVTDLFMPDMGGLELLSIVSRVYPDTVRIILTSHIEVSIVLNAIRMGETHRYLLKPWKTEEELKPMIYDGIELHQLLLKVNSYEVEIDKLKALLAEKDEEIKKLKKAAADSKTG